MSNVSLSLPQISDANIVFSPNETREILRFFWPQRREAIEQMEITNDVRRYAQALLIVAVDGSYAIGFIEILVNAIIRRKPGSSIKALVRKVTKKYVKHWWKHATREDLKDAKVYETVRASIALKQKSPFELILNGVAAAPNNAPALIIGTSATSRIVWV